MKTLKLVCFFVGLAMFGIEGFAQSTINYAEYYWDTDPGLGLGTSLGAVNTTNLNLTTNISTTGLSAGNHILNVRVRDANGTWSQKLTKVMMVAPETYNPGTDPQDIRVLEYQWDALTPVQTTVSGITNFQFTQTIPTTSLGEGSHILSIRMKDAYGFWTTTRKYNVFLFGNAPGVNISKIEYFIGTMTTDPGYGTATSVSFTPTNSPDVTANFEPTTVGLTKGENVITVRIQDAQNKWSSLYQKSFNLDPSFTLTAGNTLNQSDQAQSEFCLGGIIKVPITKTGTFPVANQYVLELSNSSGTNFMPIPTTINIAENVLTGTLPSNLTPASGYRIRAVTTLPLIRRTSATILTIGNTTTASANLPTLCEGANLQLNSTAFVTSNYSWVGPPSFVSSNQNPMINNIPVNGGGVYTVTATSITAGCTATATTSVIVKPLPTVTPTSPVTVCSGFPLTLGVNTTAGGTYNWSGPNTFTSALQNPTVSNLATTNMNGIYTITVTLNGCSLTGTSSVTVKPLPTVTPTSPIVICANTPLILDVNATAGGTYFWSGPNSFTSSLQNPMVSNLATISMTGTYTITVRLNGCSVTGTSSVTVKPLPTVIPTSPISICANTPLTLGVNATAGGTYAWSGPNSFTSSLQNPMVSSLATTSMTGTYIITVTLNGCSVTGTSFVTVKPLPIVTPITPISVCSNSLLLLEVNETFGGTYAWGGPNGFFSSFQIPVVSNNANVGMTGTYSVTVTLNGCSASGTTSVTVNPVVNPPTANGVTVNQNTSTTLSVTCTSSTPKWYNANTGGTLLGTGTYTTPNLAVNTTYYVACETGSLPNCVSSRTAQTVTICPTSLSPTNTVTTNQKAVTTVISTGINTIPNAASVTYQAGNYVQLNAGFVANSGSVFTAKILGGCQ